MSRRPVGRRAATDAFAGARSGFVAVGVEPALRACERELEAARAVIRRSAARRPGRLTRRRRASPSWWWPACRTAGVATELMASVQTPHLTRVYAKLDVKSPTEFRVPARKGELEVR